MVDAGSGAAKPRGEWRRAVVAARMRIISNSGSVWITASSQEPVLRVVLVVLAVKVVFESMIFPLGFRPPHRRGEVRRSRSQRVRAHPGADPCRPRRPGR